MVYTSIENIKRRISFEADDFFEDDKSRKFDLLLEDLEEESRDLINSYKGDKSFEYENKEEIFKSLPDSKTLALVYPVQNVSKVEVKYTNKKDEDWEELDSDFWKYTKHNLILRRMRNIYRRNQNKIRHEWKREFNDYTFRYLFSKVKVTYEKGYETIPSNVKNIQISLINRMLRKMRNEQNTANINPQSEDNIAEKYEIMTEDIKERLDQITTLKAPAYSI